jgi:hypothetical protein
MTSTKILKFTDDELLNDIIPKFIQRMPSSIKLPDYMENLVFKIIDEDINDIGYLDTHNTMAYSESIVTPKKDITTLSKNEPIEFYMKYEPCITIYKNRIYLFTKDFYDFINIHNNATFKNLNYCIIYTINFIYTSPK